VDNSLAHVAMFALVAYRNGMTISELQSRVKFFCCGDDLIWSDRTGVFRPQEISAVYASVGLYLEFDSLEPANVYDLPFVGVEFSTRKVRGVNRRAYSIRSSKARATFALNKKSATPKLRLAKFCSLCQLTYGNEQLYGYLKKATEDFVVECVKDNRLSLVDPEVKGLLHSMLPSTLERAYFPVEV